MYDYYFYPSELFMQTCNTYNEIATQTTYNVLRLFKPPLDNDEITNTLHRHLYNR